MLKFFLLTKICYWQVRSQPWTVESNYTLSLIRKRGNIFLVKVMKSWVNLSPNAFFSGYLNYLWFYSSLCKDITLFKYQNIKPRKLKRPLKTFFLKVPLISNLVFLEYCDFISYACYFNPSGTKIEKKGYPHE